MRVPGTLRAGVGVVLSFALSVSSPLPLSAAERQVALGEVSTSVVHGDAGLHAMLRATAEKELAELDFSRMPRRSGKTILSMSIVRLDTETTAKGASTTCVVSATLRTARGGNVFAILEGRARAENDAPSAVKFAVRGALGGLAEALK